MQKHPNSSSQKRNSHGMFLPMEHWIIPCSEREIIHQHLRSATLTQTLLWKNNSIHRHPPKALANCPCGSLKLHTLKRQQRAGSRCETHMWQTVDIMNNAIGKGTKNRPLIGLQGRQTDIVLSWARVDAKQSAKVQSTDATVYLFA